jgi:hypothetical protein
MAPDVAQAAGPLGHVNFILGQKALEEDDWAPVEDQGEFGAEVTWGKDDWPILIATDYLWSSDKEDLAATGVEVTGTSWELAVGIRKVWEAGKNRPYVGGGLALIGGKFEGSVSGLSVSDDDQVLGAWVGGGIFWRLGPRFNIGIAGRFSKGQVTFFGVEGEGGGSHFGLILGWGWPASK